MTLQKKKNDVTKKIERESTSTHAYMFLICNTLLFEGKICYEKEATGIRTKGHIKKDNIFSNSYNYSLKYFVGYIHADV